MSFERDDNGKIDPAYAPLEEAGEGESEGFEMAEQQLIENASHGDQHGTDRIMFDAIDEAEDDPQIDAEADSETKPDLGGER
jgi:hypothetical protein